MNPLCYSPPPNFTFLFFIIPSRHYFSLKCLKRWRLELMKQNYHFHFQLFSVASVCIFKNWKNLNFGLMTCAIWVIIVGQNQSYKDHFQRNFVFECGFWAYKELFCRRRRTTGSAQQSNNNGIMTCRRLGLPNINTTAFSLGQSSHHLLLQSSMDRLFHFLTFRRTVTPIFQCIYSLNLQTKYPYYKSKRIILF